MTPNATLYLALAFYAAGTAVALLSLFSHEKRMQHIGLALMIAGWVSHTVWIGTICVRTGHPPLTNLPEAASFVAWTVFLAELLLFVRYRVAAASFFVYPLVLMLLTVTAVVREPFAQMPPSLRSNLFITHIFLSTVGVAALLVGLAFTTLAQVQDRQLKSKHRGALWEWIPSLDVCRTLSYRTLAIGFAIYTVGLLTGIVWSSRTTSALIEPRVKQIGAIVAWVFFALVLQSYITGGYRARRTLVFSACAFVAIVVAILGIHRV
ncbi:MAG TPA: cytochrome c biogenesis protein CcsA [Thermoanaerobaculia bacterium]|nr:cytochrome c biogenesis protein CcsA [Thermoanaerobaculia bacterium]